MFRMATPQEKRVILVAVLLIYFISFYVYLTTMCPSVSVGDSGEFITSVDSLSLPHPPSYPLFSLAGKVFSQLIPWGEVSYRINLFSVWCMSTALTLLFILTVYLLRIFYFALPGIKQTTVRTYLKFSTPPYSEPPISLPLKYLIVNLGLSFCLCLSLGFSEIYWRQAVVTEVFGLNTLFFVILTYIFIYFLFTFNLPLLYLYAFIFAWGLGNHHTLIFNFPFFILMWILLIINRKNQNFRVSSLFLILTLSILVFCIGLSVYLFLLIRSQANPVIDWGNPETLPRLWRVFTRADYGTFKLTLGSGSQPLSWHLQLYRFFKALFTGFGLIPTILGIIGLLLTLRINLYLGIILFFIFLLSGPGFILLSRLPNNSESWGVLPRFYIIPLIILTLGLVCLGYYFLLRLSPNRKYGKFILIPVFILLVILLYLRIYQPQSRRNFYLAYDYGNNLLRTLPLNSYFIMQGGDDTFFTIAYLNYVRKIRTDLYPFDQGGLIFRHPYGTEFRWLSREEKKVRRELIETSLIKSVQPVFYSTMEPNLLPGIKLQPAGILYYVNKEANLNNTLRQQKALWNVYALRGIGNLDEEYRVRALIPVYQYFYGIWLESIGQIESAYRWWDMALFVGKDVDWVKNNLAYLVSDLGVQAIGKGDLNTAKKMYEYAIRINPQYGLAFANLGVIYERLSEYESAKKNYLTAINVAPNSPEGYYNLASIYWREEKWSEVVKLYEQVLKIQPENNQVQHYLSIARNKLNTKKH